MLEHKIGNISETRKDRWKLLRRAYRNSQTLFRTYHPRPPTASPSPRLEVHNPKPKLQSLLSHERLKLRTASLADTFKRSIRIKPIKIWEKRESGRVQGLSNEYPLLFQEQVKLRTSNFVRTFTGSIETKPIKHFGKSSRGRTHGLSKIFRAHIYRAHRAIIFAVAQLSCTVRAGEHKDIVHWASIEFSTMHLYHNVLKSVGDAISASHRKSWKFTFVSMKYCSVLEIKILVFSKKLLKCATFSARRLLKEFSINL